MTGERSRWRVHTGWALVAALAVGATWWASAAVLRPAVTETAQLPPAVYTVSTGTVGVEVAATGRVEFIPARTAVAGRSGVVTDITVASDGAIASGDRVLTIDLAPVIVAPGATPAFRDLALKMKGPDVAQLRQFLGLSAGDTYDWATYEAVRAWQRSLGVAVDGIVHRGDILFLPTLPARGYVEDDVSIGGMVETGQDLLTVVGDAGLLVTADAGGRFVAGMTATLTLPDGTTVSGQLSGPTREPDGLEYFRVVNADGANPCDAVCAAQFPPDTSSQVAARIELVPVAEGLVVPDAALIVRADGSLAVRTEDGDVQAVTLVARGQGTSIVEGIDEGAVIELFADPDAAP